MSWDSYIDSLMARGEGNIDKCIIFGINGALWTTETHKAAFNLTENERATIGSVLKNKNFGEFSAKGILCNGVKYMYLRSLDDITILGKKIEQGSVNFTITNQAIVGAHCPEGKQQGACNTAVSGIANYLKDSGY